MPQKNNKYTYLKRPIFWVVVILRILSALYILINPLWGYFWTLVFDYLDSYFLTAKKDLVEMPWGNYLILDKALDLMGYFAMIIVGIKMGYSMLLIFFLYRLIGQTLFLITKQEILLVIFINLFQPLFIWTVIFKLLGINPTTSWLIFLIFIQIVIEVFNHIYWPKRIRKGWPWYMRVFGGNKGPNY